MRTHQNILFHTFIGLLVEVINASARELIGKKGIIIDETKNLLVIETSDAKEFKIPKNGATFRFFLDDKSTFEVEGRKIAFRPEERAKKLL